MRVVIRPSHLETVMHAALAEAALTPRIVTRALSAGF